MNDEMKNPHAKGIKTAKTVTSAVLAGCLVASLGLNIYQAGESVTQNRKVNKFIDNQLERQAKEEERQRAEQAEKEVQRLRAELEQYKRQLSEARNQVSWKQY